ncbi:MAG TPA: hypothetical protein VHY84_23790 [Bryobacteraceae bacterium]|jgi:hypothetical protein|nr:hypothetical protein [Bryobacteraceae bacterium]
MQLFLVAVLAEAQVPAPQAPASQTPAQAPAQPQAPIAPLPTVQSLKVLVLEGNKSINNISRHIGIQPIVEVRDENDQPVEGAIVVFRLPPSGPGGSFPGNSPTLKVGTNAQGQAAASGFVPNDQQGRFDIHVTASYENRTGETTVSQTNSLNNLSRLVITQKKPLWRSKWVLIGVGAAVAGGIVLALTLSGGSSKQQVAITPGAVTIGQ